MKKVVLLSSYDVRGGAAVACLRLAKALIKSSVRVDMLVMSKSANDDFVTSLSEEGKYRKLKYRLNFYLERLQIFLNNGFRRDDLFAVSSASFGDDISEHPSVVSADVIHLHWINQGFISSDGLKKLLHLGKPIVWTMHDMWPLTGGCHHSDECMRFMEDCGKCNLLHSDNEKDLSAKMLSKKRSIYTHGSINFVGCSEWIKNKTSKGSLARGHNFLSIPNPIDINLFKAVEKNVARQSLGLPIDKKLVLFGAAIASDKRKGIDLLIEACRHLTKRDELEFVVFGQIKDGFDLGFKTHYMGYVNSQTTMISLYSSADLFVTPSLQDNLPNVIMEAMACNTPCVGFEIGGIPEMIVHRQNGYLAKTADSYDLAECIEYVLERSQSLGEASRLYVENNYRECVIAERYMDLYSSIVK